MIDYARFRREILTKSDSTNLLLNLKLLGCNNSPFNIVEGKLELEYAVTTGLGYDIMGEQTCRS